MQPYPKEIRKTIDSLHEALRQISRLREEDITDRNTYDSIFMRGRKVGKIPSGSIDVTSADRIGDFNFDAGYFYLLVNNSGTAEWRRATLGSW